MVEAAHKDAVRTGKGQKRAGRIHLENPAILADYPARLAGLLTSGYGAPLRCATQSIAVHNSILT